MIGNLASLYTRVGNWGDENELPVINLLTELARSEVLPGGLLCDRQAISLHATATGASSSTNYTAAAVPEPVQRQVRLLLSQEWLKGAAKRLLAGVDTSLLGVASQQEEERTAQTLKANAAVLALASLQEAKAKDAKWFVARWAEQLKASGRRWMNTSGTSTDRGNVRGSSHCVLVNSSATARAAASGSLPPTVTAMAAAAPAHPPAKAAISHTYQRAAVVGLCELYAVLLQRWPAAGNSVMTSALNVLSFGTQIVPQLWAFLQAEGKLDNCCDTVPVKSSDGTGTLAVISVFAVTYCHALLVLDDAELYEQGRPLPLHQVCRVISNLLRLLFRAAWVEHEVVPTPFGTFLGLSLERLLRTLYGRSSRRAICSPELWQVREGSSRRMLSEAKARTPRACIVLLSLPYCIPPLERMRLFHAFVKAERTAYQPEGVPGIQLRVRRGRVMEDGLAGLDNVAGADMKKRLQVVYISEFGHQESGIDMGGLFKDFWTDMSNTIFDLDYGLFGTTQDGLMYPNPASEVIHGREHLRLFEFLGRILGKALYEGITVQPQFATFFLSFMRGSYNYLGLFHDLAGMDPELYKNLIFLKSYDGDNVEDLCLTFTVTSTDFGENKEIPLVAGGEHIAVTNDNKLEYINRVAKYHLVDKLKPQAESFVKGLWQVISPQWLSMFNEPELQILVSGSTQNLDIDDMKRHTSYAGGYSSPHTSVKKFWNVLAGMTPAEQAALLRFVTSCPRPPPLGFESLHPPFTISRVTDLSRLPSASTCFNTLKLPAYKSEKEMKQRLLQSIMSGAGFELS
ncbi:unnamed protein product [Chrysoparadoxa australica]